MSKDLAPVGEAPLLSLSAEKSLEALPYDEYNPHNDYYEVKRREMEAVMVELLAPMNGWQTVALKMRGDGANYEAVGKKIKKSRETVRQFITTFPAQQFLRTYQYHQTVLTGPSENQRVNALWRLYIDNRHEEPTVALRAIVEINKLCKEPSGGGSGTVQIVINNEVLGKGGLD